MQKFGFTTVLCQFWYLSCGVLPESGRVGTPAETSFTMGKELKEFQLCDSRRLRKMRKMMSLNCSISLMPVFGVGKVYRIWTPKGGPPQYVQVPYQFTFVPPHRPGFLHTQFVNSLVLCHAIERVERPGEPRGVGQEKKIAAAFCVTFCESQRGTPRRCPRGSVGTASCLATRIDCRWWFDSALVHG